MAAESAPTNPSRVLKLRWTLVVAALAVALAALFVTSRETLVLARLLWLKFLPAVGAAVLIGAAAFGMGDRLLQTLRVKTDDGLERLLCGFVVGSCVVSLAVLILGACGLIGRCFWLVLLALGAIAGAAALREMAKQAKPAHLDRWAVAGLCLVVLVCALCLLSAFLPPWEYDVQEYHLGAPAEYLRMGRVGFLKDNVYSNFPSNAEMTYLLGMIVTGDKLVGAYAGKVVNVLYGLAIAGLVALAGQRAFGGKTRWEAFLAMYACPCVLISCMVAYVTMPLMLYQALAMYALLRALTSDAAERPRWLILCGLGVGAAMGTKYTGFLLTLVPIAVATCLLRGGVMQRAKHLACVLVPAAVLVSPWLVRNAINTGNPTYPLLYHVFGSRNWSPMKDARFVAAHCPKDLSVTGFFVRARDFLTNVHQTYLSGAVVLLAVAALAACARPGSMAALGALVGIWVGMVALWFFFTQQIDRFLAPSIVVLGMLAAGAIAQVSASRFGQASVRVAVLAFSALGLMQGLVIARNAGVFDGALMFDDNADARREFMERYTDFANVWAAFEFAAESLPADAKILFVGEARTFYCPRAVLASTVFDDAPIQRVLEAGDAAGALARLRAAGVTHVLFNWSEVRRLSETYAFKFEGLKRPGYLAFGPEQWRLLDAVCRKQLKLLKTVGKQYDSGERPVELYEVAYGSAEPPVVSPQP